MPQHLITSSKSKAVTASSQQSRQALTLCRPKPREASSPARQMMGIHRSPRPFFISRLLPLSVVLKVMALPHVLPAARQQALTKVNLQGRWGVLKRKAQVLKTLKPSAYVLEQAADCSLCQDSSSV